MNIRFQSSGRRARGYALMTVLVLTAAAMVILGATLMRTTTTSKLNERARAFNNCGAAAEAATEKALSKLLVDYQADAERSVTNHLEDYRGMVPTTAESPYWAGFEFSDGQGHVGKNFVKRTSVTPLPPYVTLLDQYAGLKGFASNYRIISNVRSLDSRFLTMTNAVQQDVQVAEIPVFQFAIFYNGLLEFTWCSDLTVRGRVHANSNIFVGSTGDLTFKDIVSTTGNILKTNWFGHTVSEYTGKVTYTPSYNPTNSGYATGEPSLTLPVGTNNTSDAVREILNPPLTDPTNDAAMHALRFYNQANMVIMVSNGAVNLILRDRGLDDPNPITIDNSNWTNSAYGITNWLATNIITSFYDQREGKTVRLTQINVDKFRQWTTNNSYAISSFPSGPPKILYVADYRNPPTLSPSYLSGVRLTNAAILPSGGLTVATPNPLYVVGNYNTPTAANLNSTNTAGTVPASLISDALTILSSKWDDSKSSGSFGSRTAPTNTTVNAAIITGAVPSVDNTSSGFSGGVVNLPRLLENWSNKTLTLNTSLVNLFNSAWATNKYQAPGKYYNAPTRDFNFDPKFTQPTGLPPGTPSIRRLIRAVWFNPPPNNVTTSNILDTLYEGN